MAPVVLAIRPAHLPVVVSCAPQRLHDLVVLAIGISVGVFLYALIHDLYLHAAGCTEERRGRGAPELAPPTPTSEKAPLVSEHDADSHASAWEEGTGVLVDVAEV